MDGPAISVEDLHLSYGSGWLRPRLAALRGVTLAVGAGEIVAVLGPNGSGKSTLFKVLAGILDPETGRARVLGRDPRAPGLVTQVGYQPEGALPYPHHTALDLLLHMAHHLGVPPAAARTQAATLLARVGLASAAGRRVAALSTGMARRLGFAVALLGTPRVLLLDEPTAGLDPLGSLLVMDALRSLAAEGVAILLASHQLEEVEQTCARVILLHEGRVQAEGTLDALLGTGDDLMVFRGLDAGGLARVRDAAAAAGGAVVREGRERAHLFALFRRLAREDA